MVYGIEKIEILSHTSPVNAFLTLAIRPEFTKIRKRKYSKNRLIRTTVLQVSLNSFLHIGYFVGNDTFQLLKLILIIFRAFRENLFC